MATTISGRYIGMALASFCNLNHHDSQSAIGRSQSSMYNGKSRYIYWRHNTIRQVLSTGIIWIDYIWSKDNTDDPLTEGLVTELVAKLSRWMRFKSMNEELIAKENST